MAAVSPVEGVHSPHHDPIHQVNDYLGEMKDEVIRTQ